MHCYAVMPVCLSMVSMTVQVRYVFGVIVGTVAGFPLLYQLLLLTVTSVLDLLRLDVNICAT